MTNTGSITVCNNYNFKRKSWMKHQSNILSCQILSGFWIQVCFKVPPLLTKYSARTLLTLKVTTIKNWGKTELLRQPMSVGNKAESREPERTRFELLVVHCGWYKRLVLNVKHTNDRFHLVGVSGHGWGFGVLVLLITIGSLKDAGRLKPH